MTLIPEIAPQVLDEAKPTCQASEQLAIDCSDVARWIVRMHCPCGIEIVLVCTRHTKWLRTQDLTCPECGYEWTPVGREHI